MDLTELLDHRLLLVTGKGGVGKSSLTAALSVAAARTGRRTCLVELEGQHTFARLFDTQPWDFTEREFRPGLFGLSVDPEASLMQYLEMFYGVRRISRLVVGSTAVEFATTAAPGIKDVLLLGKVKELERRRDTEGRFHYDLVVVDAPPIGRIVRFLRSPDATTELVNIGPIRSQAQSVVDLLLDADRTCAVLVTLLEEMPVTETIEGANDLREFGVAVGAVLVNRVLADRLQRDERKALGEGVADRTVKSALRRAGLPTSGDEAAYLQDVRTRYLARLVLQDEMRAELSQHLDMPQLELPEVYAEEFSDAEIRALADVIEEQVR